MKDTIKILISLCCMAVSANIFQGCTKYELPTGGVPIAFALDIANPDTKVGQTTETVATQAKILVTGTRNNTSIIDNTHRELKYNSTTDKWFPNGDATWHSWSNTATDKYSFLAYAYAPKDADTKNLVSGSPNNVTITQPTTYTYGSESSTMVDYMLSHRFEVANPTKKPIVRIRLEHALSNIEIYVVRDPSILGARVKNITFKDFFTKANMSCPNVEMYANDEGTVNNEYNKWSATYPSTQDANYVMDGNTQPFIADTEARLPGESERLAVMQVLAVPQALTGNAKKASISVTYSVNESLDGVTENYVDHEPVTFDITKAGFPDKWESGYKYIYILTVDTGIKLTAHVQKWKDGGEIEATILPEIEYE